LLRSAFIFAFYPAFSNILVRANKNDRLAEERNAKSHFDTAVVGFANWQLRIKKRSFGQATFITVRVLPQTPTKLGIAPSPYLTSMIAVQVSSSFERVVAEQDQNYQEKVEGISRPRPGHS
jgi:hypothetical protein